MNSDRCYNLLGLRKGASIPEIRDAYRKLALECHPDKNTSAKDGAKFKLITEAYQTLRVDNLDAGKKFATVSQNRSSANMYQKIRPWNFYLNVLHDVMDYTGKIKHVKTVYRYLSESESLLACYGLVRKHVIIPSYNLMMFSYTRIGSIVLHVSHRGLIKDLLRYLDLHS